MKRYLDPKADLTFKKIFGRHPDLLISLLNALLPLADDEQIQSVEYLPTELVPELYEHKNSIVDVLCRDIRGRQFCVEMQMEWTLSFKQRVLFNASIVHDRHSDNIIKGLHFTFIELPKFSPQTMLEKRMAVTLAAIPYRDYRHDKGSACRTARQSAD